MNSKIKKKQIIIELFNYITNGMVKRDIFSPLEMNISLTEFEIFINEKLNTRINSIQHIYQQIRSYERENHLHLFDKVRLKESGKKNDIVLRLSKGHNYQYKLFLHAALKNAVATGTYDLLMNLYNTGEPMNLYLSAGSESYYFVDHLYKQAQDLQMQINLYTHNLGIIQNFITKNLHLKNIKMFTRFGMVIPNELALFEGTRDHYAEVDFHAIIGSMTYIDDEGALYIESEEEHKYKKNIFEVLKGPRILLMTMFEYNIPADIKKYQYSHVNEFEYIVAPSEQMVNKHRQRLKKLPFSTSIKYYNYEVLKKNEFI